jgi:DNA-binding transcriptional MocR family regulator
MDYHSYRDAIFASNLTVQQKMVAQVIAYHYNWKKQEPAFPSNITIAKEAGVSVKTVIRSKNRLVELGYLTSEQRFNNSNLYVPTLPHASLTIPQVTEGYRGGSERPSNNEYNNELNNEKKDSKESFNSSISKSKVIFLDANNSGTSFGSFKETAGPAAASELLDWFG